MSASLAEDLRDAAEDVAATTAQAREAISHREALARHARREGMPVTEIAAHLQISPPMVYRILGRQERP